MPMGIAGRLETTTPRLTDIIQSIKKGEVKIPQFQRRFVWKEEQALDFLDSLANNYPVGSVLLWKTAEKLATERNIGEFRLPDTDDMTPTDYVLDGQQRLTVIYGCLGAPVDTGGFMAGYDLNKGVFLKYDRTFGPHVFPLRKIFDTTSLLNFREDLRALPNHQILQDKLDQLVDSFGRYSLPVVTLKDLTVDEVCPIFQRINSSGTKLSMFDLIVAMTWSTGFSLDEETQSIVDSLKKKNFYDVDQDAILKCYSSINSGSVLKSDILKMRELDAAQMKKLTGKVKAAAKLATDHLVTQYSLKNWDFLPYEALFTILCNIYSKTKVLNADQVKRADMWFWRAAFSLRYRGSSDSFVTTDLNLVDSFVINGIGQNTDFGSPTIAHELLETTFRINNSRTQAYILLLANNKPRNITNGHLIDVSEALSDYNKHEFHHVYPRNWLKINGDDNDNSIVNIIMLTSAENRNISDSNPMVYLPKCINALGNQADSVFESNILPSPKTFDYSSASYNDFCVERSVILENAIFSKCN